MLFKAQHARSAPTCRLGLGKDTTGAEKSKEADAQRKREAARRQLLSGVEHVDLDFDEASSEKNVNLLKRLRLRFYAFWSKVQRNLPLTADVRAVESRFGMSVGSYFVFYHWMIFPNALLVFLLSIASLGLHLNTLSTNGRHLMPFDITNATWDKGRWLQNGSDVNFVQPFKDQLGTFISYLPFWLQYSR